MFCVHKDDGEIITQEVKPPFDEIIQQAGIYLEIK